MLLLPWSESSDYLKEMVQNTSSLNGFLNVLSHSCLLSPAVSKASAGAMELMAVHSVNNLGRFLKEAKAEEWTILGTSGPVIPESGEEDEDEEEWEEEEEWEGRKERRIVPSVDCHGYIRQGPTLLVLGKHIILYSRSLM